MRNSILFIVFIANVVANINGYPRKDYYDVKHASKYFDKFISTYGRDYATREEYEKRLKIFKKNLVKINRLNEENPLTKFGITQFSDFNAQDFEMFTNGHRMDKGMANNYETYFDDTNITVPEELDWRTKNVVTEIDYSRSGCFINFIFVAVGNIEGQYAMKHKKLIPLSVSQALDCGNLTYCQYGEKTFPEDSLEYYKVGIESNEDYPYTPPIKQCSFDSNKVVTKVTEVQNLGNFVKKPEKLKAALAKLGPLIVRFVHNGSLNGYLGGLYSPNDCFKKYVNFAALLVGYGKTNGTETWIIKPYFGLNFGDKGYVHFDFKKMEDCQFSSWTWNAVVE